MRRLNLIVALLAGGLMAAPHGSSLVEKQFCPVNHPDWPIGLTYKVGEKVVWLILSDDPPWQLTLRVLERGKITREDSVALSVAHPLFHYTDIVAWPDGEGAIGLSSFAGGVLVKWDPGFNNLREIWRGDVSEDPYLMPRSGGRGWLIGSRTRSVFEIDRSGVVLGEWAMPSRHHDVCLAKDGVLVVTEDAISVVRGNRIKKLCDLDPTIGIIGDIACANGTVITTGRLASGEEEARIWSLSSEDRLVLVRRVLLSGEEGWLARKSGDSLVVWNQNSSVWYLEGEGALEERRYGVADRWGILLGATSGIGSFVYKVDTGYYTLPL